MNIEQAKDMIRSFRYNGTPSSRSAESSGPLCEEMPSFEQYARSRKANRISSRKIKTLIGATKASPEELDRVHRIARNGYSRPTLIQMYGLDGEVVCKRWLDQALGWHVADEITRTSASEPLLSGKADGRLSLDGEEHLVDQVQRSSGRHPSLPPRRSAAASSQYGVCERRQDHLPPMESFSLLCMAC